jgi:hypothetical protein
MNNKYSVIFLLVAAVLVISACNLNYQVAQGSGRIISETRQVSGFEAVHISGIGELSITQGKEESIRVEAEDNLMPQIKIEVRSRTLFITLQDNERFVFPNRVPKYYLTFKQLNRIEAEGAASIEGGELDMEIFEIRNDGAGRLKIGPIKAKSLIVTVNGASRQELSGKVDEQKILINGVGVYKADELESDKAVVQINGAGQAKVWVNEILDAVIIGAGVIQYKGNPSGERTINGVGTISEVGE